MAKPEWGTKRECPDCGERFYDLGKELPLICPKCAFEYEPEVLLKPKRVKFAEEVVKPVKKEEVAKKEPDKVDEDKADDTAEDGALLETDDDEEEEEVNDLPGVNGDVEDKLLEVDDDDDDDIVDDEIKDLDDIEELPLADDEEVADTQDKK